MNQFQQTVPFSYFYFEDYWGIKTNHGPPINFQYNYRVWEPKTVLVNQFQPELINPGFFDFTQCNDCSLSSGGSSPNSNQENSPTNKKKRSKRHYNHSRKKQ